MRCWCGMMFGRCVGETFPNPNRVRLPREIKGYWPRFVATALADDLGPVLLFAPRRSNAEKLARQLSQQLPNQDPLVLMNKQLVGDHMTRTEPGSLSSQWS